MQYPPQHRKDRNFLSAVLKTVMLETYLSVHLRHEQYNLLLTIVVYKYVLHSLLFTCTPPCHACITGLSRFASSVIPAPAKPVAP